MEIELVKQKHKKGCGIACLAMVSNQSYDDVVKDFINDFDEYGMTTQTLMDWLGDHDFSIVYKDIRCYSKKDFARDEMLRPFMPVHIVSVQYKVDTERHFIVMDAKGQLFCSDGTSDKDLRECYAIHEVIGLYPSY